MRQRRNKDQGLPSPIPRDSGDNSPPLICRMVFDELCVLANGEIVCSCGDPAGLRVYGKVYEDRIDKIYNGTMYREIRRWQLSSKPSSWCPVIGARCGGRVSRATAVDREDGRTVKILQLEPISFCNIRCLECPVTHFKIDPHYRSNRESILPLDTMLDIVDQLPHLEKILFYNFGEPFLHPDSVPFLREVRICRPEIIIHTCTNGLALSKKQIKAIASEALIDRVVFSIDGARPESYAHYHVGGGFEKAMENLASLLQAVKEANRQDKVEIVWQYILFEWNDSDDELDEAHSLAKQLDVPIKWVVTHTPGASRKFRPGSHKLACLTSREREYDAMTCDLKMLDLWEYNGVARGCYLARLDAEISRLSGPIGQRSAFLLKVVNQGGKAWRKDKRDAFGLGVCIRSETGRNLKELGRIPLPPSTVPASGVGEAFVDFRLPDVPGSYQLLVDIVEEGVCWFHERGSQPLVLQLDVFDGNALEWKYEEIVMVACRILLQKDLDVSYIAGWAREIRNGVTLEDFLIYLGRENGISISENIQGRFRFWQAIQPLIC